MSNKSGITYQNGRRVFQGARFDVLDIEARHPQGGIMLREVVDHPGAVVILPLLDDQTVLLIRNERYAVQRHLLELPAGTMERGEEAAACAARELEEETGYTSKAITPLLQFFSTPGFCNEILYVYLARDLVHVGQSLDETEAIDVVPTPLSEALKMIQEGAICDAKTICALLYFHTYSKR